MKYEFHPEAEFEVIEYAARYESDVPGLGERFGDEVERVVELLYIIAVAHGSREPD